MISGKAKVKEVRRTIRPKTHACDHSYRVKIGERNFYEQLVVYIDHEDSDFKLTFVFEGKEIAPYESIHFKAKEVEGRSQIEWVQKLKFKILES